MIVSLLRSFVIQSGTAACFWRHEDESIIMNLHCDIYFHISLLLTVSVVSIVVSHLLFFWLANQTMICHAAVVCTVNIRLSPAASYHSLVQRVETASRALSKQSYLSVTVKLTDEHNMSCLYNLSTPVSNRQAVVVDYVTCSSVWLCPNLIKSSVNLKTNPQIAW